jgi:hypothetical protein
MIAYRLVRTMTLAVVFLAMVHATTDGHTNALGVAKQVTAREGAFACGPASTAGNISGEAPGDGEKGVKTDITTQRADQTPFDMGKEKDFETAALEPDGRGHHQGGRQEAAKDIAGTCRTSTIIEKMDPFLPSNYRKSIEDQDPSDRFPFSRRRRGRLEIGCHTLPAEERTNELRMPSPCSLNVDGFQCTCNAILGVRLGRAPRTLYQKGFIRKD